MTLAMHLSMCFSHVYVTFMFGRQVRLDVDALEYVETFTITHIRTHGTHVSFYVKTCWDYLDIVRLIV